MTVRLQLVLGCGWGSRAISWFSAGGKQGLSHVDALMQDGSHLIGARSDRVGGEPPGVRIRPPGYEAWKARIVFDIPATDAQGLLFHDFLTAQIGKPYDRSVILAFILGRNWREKDSWICSELIAAALEYARIVPPLYLVASRITPVALALLVTAAGGKEVKNS